VSSASLRFGFWIEAEVEVKELYCIRAFVTKRSIRAFVAKKLWCFGALVAKRDIIRAFVVKSGL